MNTFTWSAEQNTIFETALAQDGDNPRHPFIKVEAVAGAAKSTTLVELAKRYHERDPNTSFRYLVFGSANSAEAKLEFKHTAVASTIHSLAYQAVIVQKMYPLQSSIRSFLTWRDIPKSIRIPFGETPTVLNVVTDYCNSPYLTLSEFTEAEGVHQYIATPAKQILQGMLTGAIPSTHAFYLKLFHKAIVSGQYVPPEVDVLAIDEAGDLTPISEDIFRCYPAKQKLLVGDSKQSILHFLGCVNAFDTFRDTGITLPLTQSFRCSVAIATEVQKFCRDELDTDMVFEGMEYPPDPVIKSVGIQTLTNSELLAEMIKLNRTNTPYKLISKAKETQLFKYPEFLMYIGPGKVQKDPELRVLQQDVDHYIESSGKTEGVISYLLEIHSENSDLRAAFKLIMRYKRGDIIAAKEGIQRHMKSSANVVLGTAFVFKGATFDKTILSDGLNDRVEELLAIPKSARTDEEVAILKLYYVANTRARYSVENSLLFSN